MKLKVPLGVGLLGLVAFLALLNLLSREPEPGGPAKRLALVTTTNPLAYAHDLAGEQFIQQLKFDQAEGQFNQAITLDTNFALAYYHSAYAVAWKHQREQLANELWSRALALSDRLPEKERCLVRAEHAKAEQGLQAGLAVLRELERVYPNDKELLFNLGDWSFHAGEHETAIACLKRVLKQDPTFEPALNHLTLVYQSLGRFDEMLMWAKRYAFLTASEDALNLLHRACFLAGEFELGSRTLRRALALFPTRHDLAIGLADYQIFLGHFSEAEVELKKLAAPAQSPEARKLGTEALGNLCLYQGRYREALRYRDQKIEAYTKANEVELAAMTRVFKGLLYLWGWGDARQARREAERRLRDLQTVRDNTGWLRAVFYPKSFLLFGRLYEQKGDPKRALEHYQTLINLWAHADPDLADLRAAKERIAFLRAKRQD